MYSQLSRLPCRLQAGFTLSISEGQELTGGVQKVIVTYQGKTTSFDITINKAPGSLVEMPANSNLNDLIRALNSIGVAPVDLISILQALKKSGSLQAELIII